MKVPQAEPPQPNSDQRKHAFSNRRRFLQSGIAALAPLAIPRRCWGASANETLNLAAVGVGGKGWSDLNSSAAGERVRVVALCDVDASNLGKAVQKYPQAAAFEDYRRMLDRMDRDVDAVLVSTPDHMHAPIALAAMQLGKHVHVQKPLSNSLHDLRAMQEIASDNPRLVTQMGTQIHSTTEYRTATAMIRRGILGKISEAHLWVSKSWAGPAEGPPVKTDPIPYYLNWDLWLGNAPKRPFVDKLYHPSRWRGWKDFGAGTLGDMGCHIFDPAFAALDLGPPTSIISRGPQHYEETFAPDGDVTYRFESTPHTTDDFVFRWTDGSGPSRPDAARAQLPPDVKLPEAGVFFVGEKGVMVLPHWAMPRFYANNRPLEVDLEKLEANNHYTEFTDACRGIGQTSTPFEYSCPVTEAVLVGVVAGSFRDRELTWQSKELQFDHQPANECMQPRGREMVSS